MKKILTCVLTIGMILSLGVGAFASGEASGGVSGGPASLSWEESAALSRESAVIWQEDGNESYRDTVIVSKDDDFTAVFAEGGALTMEDITILTSGREAQSPNTTMHFADANFYGTAAAVLAGVGAELTMDGAVIATTGEGANGVFSYGGIITLKNAVIETYGNENAHGIDAVTGGYIYGENIDVYTSGINSGVAATDTGGGTIVLVDSALASRMSPGVYMDGDGVASLTNTTVTVGFDRDGNVIDWAYVTNDGADGVSNETKINNAEGLVLTGNAEITATNTDVTAPYGVKFHSQSATSQVGVLNMTGGSITSTAFDVIYVTGANGSGVLDGVTCVPMEGRCLIRVCNLVPANLAEEGVGAKICAAAGDFTLKNGEYTGDVWALNASEEEEWGAQLDDASRYDNSLALTLENADWTGAAIHVSALTLADGAMWTVTGDSDIGTLTVGTDCGITVPDGASVTVNGKAMELAAGIYENVSIIFE
ncbi:MAG: hypothetical protein ACI3W7_06660 [Oscillospiraceae bacterium]